MEAGAASEAELLEADNQDIFQDANLKSLIECQFLTKNLWKNFWAEGEVHKFLNLVQQVKEEELF